MSALAEAVACGRGSTHQAMRLIIVTLTISMEESALPCHALQPAVRCWCQVLRDEPAAWGVRHMPLAPAYVLLRWPRSTELSMTP